MARTDFTARLAAVWVLFAFGVTPPVVRSQSLPPAPPTTPASMMPMMGAGTWLGLTAAQASSSNWTGGGQDFVSIATLLRSTSVIDSSVIQLRLNGQLRLGATYFSDTTSTDPFRVGDNEAFMELRLSVPAGWSVDPYVSASIRTPITESFTYFGNRRTRIGSFLDPASMQQAAGLAVEQRKPNHFISTRLGLSRLEIRSEHHTQMSDDPKTKDVERLKVQTGIESVTETTLRIDSLVTYTARLGLFGSFENLEVWTVRSDNEFRLQIWKSFGVVLSISIVHDTKQTLRTQLKQSLSIGLLQQF